MTFYCSYKSSPVLSTKATSNLEDVLANENAATVIFVENQVSYLSGVPSSD